MSWKDKDWDYLRFYNNERATLEEAAASFFKCNKNESAYLDGGIVHLNYDEEELVAYRLDKDIWQPNEYDKRMLQTIADYYNVCIRYNWLSSYCIFDIKPTKK